MSLRMKKELVHLCQQVGRKVPVWTQGAGGNISVKEGDSLWIKATGYRLDAVSEAEGIAQVDFKKMAQVLDSESWSESTAEENYAELIKNTTQAGPGFSRASMETGFHARLSKKYVLHFHSLASLLFYHESNKNKERVRTWLNKTSGLKTEWIEACRPGWVLSKKVFGSASVYFLESHGIILQGDDTSILDEWTQLEKKFCLEFGYEELHELLTTEINFEELFKKFGKKPMPFKCYFPDVAVFSERLQRCLDQQQNGLFAFTQHPTQTDRDMAELWLATQMLYRFCPEFKEVPLEIASVVKELPTEKLRQQRELNHG